MADIALRGELWDNDSADVLRWWGWRDITAPMDVAAALEAAGGEDVTLLINSPGGDMAVGLEIRSMLRRYKGNTTALFQGHGASAATLAATGCRRIQSEPGALLCYHNPSNTVEGDYRDMGRAAEALRQRQGLHPGGLHRPGRRQSPGGAHGPHGSGHLDQPPPRPWSMGSSTRSWGSPRERRTRRPLWPRQTGGSV